MSPKRKVALGVSSRAARVKQRAAVGPLSATILAPATVRRYTVACQWLFQAMSMMNLDIGSEPMAFDRVICQIIDAAWEEGESRNLMGDILSGIQHFVPQLKGQLQGSWRLFTAWGRRELPCRATPLSYDAACAIAAAMWRWSFFDAALTCLLCFHCILRTAEATSITCSQFRFGNAGRSCVISLPFTKGTQRKGVVEAVTVLDPGLCSMLHTALQFKAPGERLLDRQPHHFRSIFKAACDFYNLRDGYKPYSLRRGGCTHFFKTSASLDLVTERGRWASHRTARIYINVALSEEPNLAPADAASIASASNWLRNELKLQ
jgi:hypothetical protein